MHKKAMSISLVLLVVVTLMLIGTSLVYFAYSERGENVILKIPSEIDSVYKSEAILNFYLREAFDKASIDITPNTGKDVFIQKFKGELVNYKITNNFNYIPEIYQVDSTINENNVNITSEKISLTLDITLENRNFDKGIYIKYNYKKVFEKKF